MGLKCVSCAKLAIAHLTKCMIKFDIDSPSKLLPTCKRWETLPLNLIDFFVIITYGRHRKINKEYFLKNRQPTGIRKLKIWLTNIQTDRPKEYRLPYVFDAVALHAVFDCNKIYQLQLILRCLKIQPLETISLLILKRMYMCIYIVLEN